jgi:rod shape-determining protein MreD
MIKTLQHNIFRFLAIVLVQILVFNNIEISSYINPYVYILFIILLPFETPRSITLLLGFLLGITLDIFSETMGMHTAATIFIAYLRPFVLSIFAPREGYEKGTYPRVYYFGLSWFIKYTSVLVIAHHIMLFFIEMFSMHDFFATLFRIILSAVASIAIITISQFFVFRK